MLLPPQFKDEALKTLGPPIRKEEEKKPVEVEVRPGIYRVNGKLETRIRENEDPGSYPSWVQIPEVDIPLPEFKPVWRQCLPPFGVILKMRSIRTGEVFEGCAMEEGDWSYYMEWLDEGR